MRVRQLGDVLKPMRGGLLPATTAGHPDFDRPVAGAAIDSRRVNDSDLFFALPGEQFHGARFAEQAWRAGAAAVVLAQADLGRLADARVSGPVIVVDDAPRALARLTRSIRDEEVDRLPAVAITGSVGKTTTCRYAQALLSPFGATHRPPASYNNDLGVPVTVLTAPDDCAHLITEIGSNGAGEVYRLASWVRPRVGIITAVEHVHLKGFGSLEAIELEKLSILDAVEEHGIGWIPQQLAERHESLLRSCPVPIRTFGPGGDLEVHSNGILGRHHVVRLRLDDGTTREVHMEWSGPHPHSPRNLEAALAAGLGLGFDLIDLVARVGSLDVPPLRGETQVHAGVEFVLDCYNASPASLESAIVRLETQAARGRRVCVIGTMEELGCGEREWHERLGARLATANVDRVFLIGRGQNWYQHGMRAWGRQGELIDDGDDAVERVAASLHSGDRVLFKASRVEALEGFADRVAEVLEGVRETV